MAFYSGSANDLTALRAALTTACTSEGWAWNSATEMLSKGALYLRLQIVGGYLTLLGRTSAGSGDAPNVARIGQIGSVPVTFPVAYKVFVFTDEVYLVISYNVDTYQWCAFGKSTIQGLPGSGMWFGAPLGSTAATTGCSISATSSGHNSACSPALFWRTSNTYTHSRSDYVCSDLDGGGWSYGQSANDQPVGIRASVPLIGLLPNSWNSEGVLLPIRAWKIRPSNKVSLIADLEHARYTRIDNYAPGEVITLGADRWMIFPWYRKDSSARDGGNAVYHTGTFGWAIRYEGP